MPADLARRAAEYLGHADKREDATVVDPCSMPPPGVAGAVAGLEPTVEAMIGRVLASGGSVGVVQRHAGLAARGGVGSILRYAA